MAETTAPANGTGRDIEIPPILEPFLAGRGLAGNDLYEIAFEDIGAESYFVLTAEALFKVEAASGILLEEIALAAVTRAELRSMVGGGLFEIYLDKSFREIARFSNTRMKSFGRITKLINEYIKEKRIKDEGETDRDIACPTCKRPLPDRDTICPFCLNKKKVLWRFLGFVRPYRWTATGVFLLLLLGLGLQMVAPQLFRFILDEVLVTGGDIPSEVLAVNRLTDADVMTYALQDRGTHAYAILTADKRFLLVSGAEQANLSAIPLDAVTAVRMEPDGEDQALILTVDGAEQTAARFSARSATRFEAVMQQVKRHLAGRSLRKEYKYSLARQVILWSAGLVLTPDNAGAFSKTGLLAVIVVLMLIRWAFNLVADVCKGRISAGMGNALVRDLRSAVFHHLQKLSFSFFDKRQTGALMSRVANDTEHLQGFIMQAVFHFLPNMLILVIILGVLFGMDWRLTLWVLIPAPVVFFGTFICWKKFIALVHRYFGARARLGAEVNDAISGIRVVRAFGQEKKSIERFEERNYEMFDARVGFERYMITVFSSLGHFTQVGFFLIYLFGGYMVLGGDLSIGAFMAFTMYLGMFLPALQVLSHMGEWLSGSLAAAQRVFDVLDTEPEVKSIDEGIVLDPIKGDIAFEDVTYGYESFKAVLKNVTLSVKAGELIGLVGESGVGKTTMTNLICRFYDVPDDSGRILVDGVPIKEIQLRSLRNQIGIVLQEPFLFQGTIAENIAYPKPDASMDEIIAAAKAANAHDFIMKFNEGYETSVGERGGRLSGGEKQRLSIARAILHNPRILILDEATSSVDTNTEKKIQEALARLTKGRTTFAIAHRLSTLRNADRLVVLDKGGVAEMGTHTELIEKKGVFWKLVNTQKESTEAIQVGG